MLRKTCISYMVSAREVVGLLLWSNITHITHIWIGSRCYPLFWSLWYEFLTHCGRVTQSCVFNMVNLGTSASSP
jgi:hypothetical protein